jgi:predicted TIM-barrel fold metal-dependent hydrolase
MARPIIDAHHHLWPGAHVGGDDYLLEQLHADTASVRSDSSAIAATVFMECGVGYRSDGPDHLKPVGEVEFVASVADASDEVEGPSIVGIVGSADLSLPLDQLDEVLDAHVAAGGGRFRGIRDALASAPAGAELLIAGRAAPGKAAGADFRRGVQHLGERGLTYDSWHYHMQNGEFLDLARACPGTTMVLDHFGTPLGVFEDLDEIYPRWQADITAIAALPNTVAKIGGLAMPDNGFAWMDPAARPDPEAFVAAQEKWYHHTIEAFGPDRCMFESNFPVDSLSLDYATYWDGCRIMADRYDPADQHHLFAGTAARVYSLEIPS